MYYVEGMTYGGGSKPLVPIADGSKTGERENDKQVPLSSNASGGIGLRCNIMNVFELWGSIGYSFKKATLVEEEKISRIPISIGGSIDPFGGDVKISNPSKRILG